MYVRKHKWFGLFWKIKDELGSSRGQAGGKAGPKESLASHAWTVPCGNRGHRGSLSGVSFLVAVPLRVDVTG